MKKYGVCISGGAIQGLSLLASMDYYRFLHMRHRGRFDKISYYFGCSAGSIIGFMLSQKMDVCEVGMSVAALCETLECVKEQMIKFNPKLATLHFRDLDAEKGTWFGCIATHCKTKELKTFSPQTTPDVLVIDAVMASSSMANVFPPTVIDGEEYEDGGTIKMYPLLDFLQVIPDDVNVLGVTLYTDKPGAPEWIKNDIVAEEDAVTAKYGKQRGQRDIFSVRVPVMGRHTTNAPLGVLWAMMNMTKYWCTDRRLV
jgi:predicted acylesterase/phospholipase RssA